MTTKYIITNTENGVGILEGERVISRYSIKRQKNGNWQVRLHGASFGFQIIYQVKQSHSYDIILSQCVEDLNQIIDFLKEKE